MYIVLSKKVILSAQVFFIILVRYFNRVICSFNRVIRLFNCIVRSVYINNPFSKAM
jgi:hypothetical protein